MWITRSVVDNLGEATIDVLKSSVIAGSIQSFTRSVWKGWRT